MLFWEFVFCVYFTCLWIKFLQIIKTLSKGIFFYFHVFIHGFAVQKFDTYKSNELLSSFLCQIRFLIDSFPIHMVSLSQVSLGLNCLQCCHFKLYEHFTGIDVKLYKIAIIYVLVYLCIAKMEFCLYSFPLKHCLNLHCTKSINICARVCLCVCYESNCLRHNFLTLFKTVF